jgi:hypothetical protein
MLQRFLPSEFGHDVDRADPVEPGLTMYKQKRLVRRVIEESVAIRSHPGRTMTIVIHHSFLHRWINYISMVMAMSKVYNCMSSITAVIQTNLL